MKITIEIPDDYAEVALEGYDLGDRTPEEAIALSVKGRIAHQVARRLQHQPGVVDSYVAQDAVADEVAEAFGIPEDLQKRMRPHPTLVKREKINKGIRDE